MVSSACLHLLKGDLFKDEFDKAKSEYNFAEELVNTCLEPNFIKAFDKLDL